MKPFRERNAIRVGLVGAAVMLVIGLVTFLSDDLPLIGGATYQAEFTEGAGLKRNDEVRVAGVKVGEVRDVELKGNRVVVSFSAKNTWIGDKTTAAIKIKTLLGQKNLVLDPRGSTELDPDTAIPRARTRSPYDVNDALGDLARTTGEIDSHQLEQSFRALSEALGATAPQNVRSALDGVSAMSRTLASRDEELSRLFAGTDKVSHTLADRTDQVGALIRNGDALLGELNARREAIGKLFRGVRDLSVQLNGLVADNKTTLAPALDQLERVSVVLQRNQDKLADGLRLAGPFYRLAGNAAGNGHWVDSYICGLVQTSDVPGSCHPPRPGG